MKKSDRQRRRPLNLRRAADRRSRLLGDFAITFHGLPLRRVLPAPWPRNYFSTILDYSVSMGTRPDDSKKAVRTRQRRQTLLAAWLDVLDQLDGPGRQRPEIPARSTIPTSRQPRSARTRRRLATYSQEEHVAAVTARLRRTAPL